MESPKEVVVESAAAIDNVVNDEDPLAIDEENGRVIEAETPVAEKAGTCDENAKDESEFGTQYEDSDKLTTLQSDHTEGNFEFSTFNNLINQAWCRSQGV